MTDPRPYNYEFRKSRPDNRTFQSYNAYESLYHMGKVLNQGYSNSNNFMAPQHAARNQRYSEIQQTPPPYPQYPQSSYSKHYANVATNTDKYSNKSQNPSVKSRSSSMSVRSNEPQVRPSVLASYGSNSLNKKHQIYTERKPDINLVETHFQDGAQVFRRQQKTFDIVNNYVRPVQPLRKFPKLTREHILLQRGMDFSN